jgi:acyl carrier protein
MENLDERIKDVMASVFDVEASIITENTIQSDIAEWDSLKHLNLIVSLEDEFDVTFPLEEVGNMTTYKYIKQIVSSLI